MKTDLKTLRKYNIDVMLSNNDRKMVLIKGYRVIFHQIPSIEFFVHRPYMKKELWIISETQTGFAFPNSCRGKTRQIAISLAKSRLMKVGINYFKQLRLDCINKVKDGIRDFND